MRHALIAALWLSFPAAALAGDKITPEKAAEVQHAKNKAEAEVQKKYGNKKDSELSKEERKAKAKDLNEAALGVYKKEGVEGKDFERYKGKQPKDDREKEKVALEGLVKKDKEAAEAEKAKAAEKEKADKANAAGENIPIQRGFSDKNPVELENLGGAPTVEKGLPEEATREMEEARGASGGPPPEAAGSSGKPAGKAKSKSR